MQEVVSIEYVVALLSVRHVIQLLKIAIRDSNLLHPLSTELNWHC